MENMTDIQLATLVLNMTKYITIGETIMGLPTTNSGINKEWSLSAATLALTEGTRILEKITPHKTYISENIPTLAFILENTVYNLTLLATELTILNEKRS